MHLGFWAISGTNASSNFYHIVFNNSAHDSVGGQPTVGSSVDFPAIARACGYRTALSALTEEELVKAIDNIDSMKAPLLIEIKVAKGARKNLGRPTTSPVQNKKELMDLLQNK